MSTMEAVVLQEWGGEMATESVEAPTPDVDDVRVEVKACGVTRTIENAIQGGLSDDPSFTPRIPGHEFAGVVDSVGEDVTGVDEGDRVLSYFYLTCGQCDACRRGDTAQCLDFGGWYGVHRDGAYAEYATLPADNVLPLPDGAGFAAGAIATDGLGTPLHICERAAVDDADTVLIIGAGGRIGIHLAQLAALRGAHVLAAEVTDDRLNHVDRHTPSHVQPFDARGDGLTDRIEAATPYADGPTVVVDTVGDTETLNAAWHALGMGGEIISLTTHHDRSLSPPLREFVVNESSLRGSRYTTKDQVVRAARLLADERIEPVITDRIGLDEVPGHHEKLRSGETHGMTVVEP